MDMNRTFGVVWASRFRSAIVLVLVLGSCSTAATGPDDTTTTTVAPGTQAAVAALEPLCTGIVSTGLGGGTLCVDSRFRMDEDRFSFANWGRSRAADDNVTVQTLVDLFGHSQVCMPGPETECVARPGAGHALQDWNVALAGGRCEGFAVLSQRMFLRYDVPSDFGAAYSRASDVARAAPGLASVLVHWWATQFVPEVQRAAALSRTRSPGELVAELISGLANGAGHTVGLYSGGTGHSVTPFAVTRRGDTWVVHVYDNNDPRIRHELLVSPAEGTWRYEGPTETWEGTTGTMEITPLDVREGPFTCPFCSAPDDETVVSIASRDGPAHPMIVIDAGELGTVEQTADGFLSTIEGAVIEPGKGRGGAVTVRFPAPASAVRIELRGVDGVPHSPATVTVRRPGHADLQVREAVAATPVGAARVTAPLLALDPEGTTVTAAGGQVQVSIAGASNLGTVPVAKGDVLLVSRVSRGTGGDTAELSYETAAATSSALAPFVLELAPATATDTNIVAKNGVLVATASPAQAQPVRPARKFRYVPMPTRPATTTTTPANIPSVDVTLPG
jgi:hypothetical protein